MKDARNVACRLFPLLPPSIDKKRVHAIDKVKVVATAVLLPLACPGIASAHGEPIVYTVWGVFFVYQVVLASMLYTAKKLERRRPLALACYALALGAVWKWFIIDPLDWDAPYFLLCFGIPAVIVGVIYFSLRNEKTVSGTVSKRKSGDENGS